MSTEDAEIECLASIYSKNGEFVYNRDNRQFTICLTELPHPPALIKNIQFTCSIPNEYPAYFPSIHVVKPEVTRAFVMKINENLHGHLLSNSFVGEPMLFEIIQWTKRYLENNSPLERKQNSVTYSKNYVEGHENLLTLIQLDHMRSKPRYIAYLRSWAKELKLMVHLLFFKHYIFVVVVGQKSSKSEFMKRWKLQNIDIDSKGIPCKECKLTVLSEQPVLIKQQLCHEQFRINEFSLLADLQQYFLANFNNELYEHHILKFIFSRL